MDKWVVFKFGEGSFEQGFPVMLQIGETNQRPSVEVTGKLPPEPTIPTAYSHWQSIYRSLGHPARMQFPEGQITNVSVTENCQQAAQDLRDRLNQWLRSETFRPLRESLIEHVKSTDTLQLVLQIQDLPLQRLPWHLCDLFERYTHTELALSTLNYQKSQGARPRSTMRVLAILGGDDNINLQSDEKLLQQFPKAVFTFLVKPQRWQLNEQLWQQHWDILFFAGHSSSAGEVGRLLINDTDSLTIADLKYGLRIAVNHGLKLAIFNSCDSLGLATALADLHISQIIVMREPVPDRVAQAFLQFFLRAFSQQKSVSLAVRKAREQLKGLEGMYPCATWLPVIYQNPAEAPLVWAKPGIPGIKIGVAMVMAVISGLLVWWLGIPKRSSSSSATAYFSHGEQVLITANATPEKLAAAKAFANRDYATAIAHLNTSLQLKPNDPEARIYLNNAKAAQTGNTYQIAASVPIGGNLGNAEEILRGVAQAQEQINQQGGINGKFLQIELANDNNDPTLTTQVIAPHLIADPTILAVIGHNASETSIAAAPLYQEAGLVMISPTSGALELSDIGSYIFRTVPSVKIDANNLANYAIHTVHQAKFATCTDSASPYSTSLKQEFINAVLIEGAQVSKIPCDLADPTFNPTDFVAKAIADGANGLLLIPSTERIEQGIKLVKVLKGRLLLLSGSTMYSFKTLQLGQVDVDGMVIATIWHSSYPTATAYVRQAKALWKAEVNWRTAMSYDASQAIITALKQRHTRSGLQNILRQPTFTAPGASGPVQFLPSGDRKRIPGIGVLVSVQAVPGATTGYNFVPLK
ncbi:ABC transporter substrate-binding protein [Pantanalinema sp. GBBB05]|uniref:ABC transporter substrate-binding protein n=1 Tax=Pantanalinema sp. GBBB05 TaxID=2604139 RepID=UPI001E12EB2A|nr:ABC transporter substrate-binding protein [Pantanalinema sp. GBBB05]